MKKTLVLIIALATMALSMLTGCAASRFMGSPTSEAPAMDYYDETDESSYEGRVEYEMPSNSAGQSEDPDVSDLNPDIPRMIIYNGAINMVVKDTGAAQEKIVQLAESSKGYISNASSYAQGSGLMRIELTLRIPADQFQTAMASLRDMAMEITHESIGSQDVTQEYVDLESRLRALESKAARLEELMEDAEDTEAVLAVYEQLSSTQLQIEEIKGRMKYLERSSAMATITINMTPDELSQPVEIAGWRPQGTAKQAIEALIKTYQGIADLLIWFVLLGIPVLFALSLVIFVIVRALGGAFKALVRRQQKIKTEKADKAQK